MPGVHGFTHPATNCDLHDRKGDPYENAIAERVNGILKGEFCLNRTFKNYEEAYEAVKGAITIYNEQRPHRSLDYHTPEQAKKNKGCCRKGGNQN